MTVLMSYHKLVERESKFVDPNWKYIAVAILLISVGASFVTSFSLQALLHSYKNHCVLYSNLVFIDKQRAEKNVEADILLDIGITDNSSNISNVKIDEYETRWGYITLCEYSVFTPLLQGFIAIVWLTLFIMCGVGGKGEASILPKPWRIVIPALIFFAIMGTISFAYSIVISDGFRVFCNEFQKFNNTNIPCVQMINYFRLIEEEEMITPAKNFVLAMTFPWVMLACWCAGFLLMFLRFMFVVDFQLIRVTITTVVQKDERNEEEDAAFTRDVQRVTNYNKAKEEHQQETRVMLNTKTDKVVTILDEAELIEDLSDDSD